ncbi:diaminobutyrate acetyltransferase [bacterium LRH843]|nr:diaminobutyrate acetyltransferase [bacterium LRH843]
MIFITQTKEDTIQFLKPSLQDGAAMWELVKQSTLDENSAYKYLLMCKYFSETCAVAKEEETVIGFVTAFIPPEKQNVLFIWQIGVSASHRGMGIASQLLHEVSRRHGKQIEYVEATITPSNKPSQALFQRLAKTYETTCEVSECFQKDLFPQDQHEEEQLYRIGPFKNTHCVEGEV